MSCPLLPVGTTVMRLEVRGGNRGCCSSSPRLDSQRAGSRGIISRPLLPLAPALGEGAGRGREEDSSRGGSSIIRLLRGDVGCCGCSGGVL